MSTQQPHPQTHLLDPHLQGHWALILGASSGFGAATARALAQAGMNIFGIHLDRRNTMANVERLISDIQAQGRQATFFNINAADAERRAETVEKMKQALNNTPGFGVRVLMHSLAFGTLKTFIGETEKEQISPAQVAMTLDVMANSLIYWTQDVVREGMMGPGGRIFSMTSGGDLHVIPAYGAVSGAKAALEAYTRQLAVELAPKGITVNALKAGVSNTPALQKIPGSALLLEGAMRRNPHGRLTTAEDVAQAIVTLSGAGAAWITGNVINVDGGEDIVA